MKRIATALVALLTAVGVLGLSGCANAGAGSGSGVTINYGQLGSAKLVEALLEASGQTPTEYKIDYKLFPNGGPGFLEAVASDSVDVGIMADTPSIFAQANNIPVKAVGVARTVDEDQAYVKVVVKGDSPLQTAADLRGKKVATTEATILQYTLIQVLAGAGLTLNDIEVVNLPPADAVAAFQSGDVDAVTSLDPQLSQLELNGARSIADGHGITSGYSYAVATDKALADPAKSAAIEDLLQRIQRAYDWAHAHPEEWATKHAALTGLKPEVSQAILARENFTFVPIDDSVIAEQQKQADVYHDQGLLKTKLDVTAEYDTRFNAKLTGGN